MIKRAKLTLVNKEKLPDGTILYKYQKIDKTSFYHKIYQNGEHEFGGEIHSKDIRDVENLTGKTLDKNRVFVIIERKPPEILGSVKIASKTGNPKIRLSFDEFYEFEEMLKTGSNYNQAFDVIAAQKISKQLELERPKFNLLLKTTSNLLPSLNIKYPSYRLPSGNDSLRPFLGRILKPLQNEPRSQ